MKYVLGDGRGKGERRRGGVKEKRKNHTIENLD
jgi:hypothetical protein